VKSSVRQWLWAVACLLVLTSVLLVVAIKVPLSRLDVPYTYSGDAVDKLAQIQTVAETGWLFDNPRLGYPFGYDRLDFPRFDSLNYALMGPVAAVTGEAGLAMNLYYLASYYLIGLTALFAFRQLGLSFATALLCAVAYAFLPYHQIRGVAHLTNGTYFLAPLAALVLTWVARARLDLNAASRERWLIALGTAVLLPLQTPYNGVFFGLLCVAACGIALAGAPRWRVVWPACILVLAVSSAFLLEQVPAMRHEAMAGPNPAVAARSAAESELYALRVNQLVLPPTFHRFEPFARAKRAFDASVAVPAVESRDQYLGILGLFGVLGLAWSLARTAGSARTARSELEMHVLIATFFVIAILAFAVSSGLATLFAHFVTTKIRATNRIFPFLAFPVLLGAGWLLQSLLTRIKPAVPRIALLAAIGIVALADVTTPRLLAEHEALVRQFDSDREFFTGVERELPPSAAVFELPAAWYPEQGSIGDMPDYESFKPYLHSRRLRFSYGGANGREGHAWATTVQSLPADVMVSQLRQQGFSAVLLHARAYASSDLARMTAGLREASGNEARKSADGRWHLFVIANTASSPGGRSRIAATYDPRNAALAFGVGEMGGLALVRGWAAPEDWGVWSLGPSSDLRLRLDPRPTGDVVLVLDARVMLGSLAPARTVVVKSGQRTLAKIRHEFGKHAPAMRVPVPNSLIGGDGLLDLRFEVSPAASPRTAGINADDRPLGIGLVSLSIETVR
jgi:phosphoglycerol transferase